METDFITNFLSNPTLHHSWAAITGFVVLTLVYILKKSGFVQKMPSKFVPTVSVLFGVLLAFGDKLITSQTSVWYDTLIQGLVAGASATGFWELVFKHVVPTIPQQPAATPEFTPMPAAPVADVPPVVMDIPPSDPTV